MGAYVDAATAYENNMATRSNAEYNQRIAGNMENTQKFKEREYVESLRRAKALSEIIAKRGGGGSGVPMNTMPPPSRGIPTDSYRSGPSNYGVDLRGGLPSPDLSLRGSPSGAGMNNNLEGIFRNMLEQGQDPADVLSRTGIPNLNNNNQPSRYWDVAGDLGGNADLDTVMKLLGLDQGIDTANISSQSKEKPRYNPQMIDLGNGMVLIVKPDGTSEVKNKLEAESYYKNLERGVDSGYKIREHASGIGDDENKEKNLGGGFTSGLSGKRKRVR